MRPVLLMVRRGPHLADDVLAGRDVEDAEPAIVLLVAEAIEALAVPVELETGLADGLTMLVGDEND